MSSSTKAKRVTGKQATLAAALMALNKKKKQPAKKYSTKFTPPGMEEEGPAEDMMKGEEKD